MDVGIADTLFELPPGLSGEYNVIRGTNVNPEDTISSQSGWGHGLEVFERLSTFLPDSKYYFYQYMTPEQTNSQDLAMEPENDKKKRGTDLLDAIKQAEEDSVDILNISAGVFHQKCNGCLFDRAVKSAIEADVTIVAAVGNQTRSTLEHTHCPALKRDVISVGGYIPYCPKSNHSKIEGKDPISVRAPHRNGGISEFQICSGGQCEEGIGCNDAQRLEEFELNPLSIRNNPDVHAPPFRAVIDDQEGVLMKPATSFATPLAAAAIGRSVLNVKKRDDMNAQEFIRWVRDNSEEMGEQNLKLFSPSDALSDTN